MTPFQRALRLEWKIIWRLLLFLYLLYAVLTFFTFDGTCANRGWDSGKGRVPCTLFDTLFIDPLMGFPILLIFFSWFWIPAFIIATLALWLYFKNSAAV